MVWLTNFGATGLLCLVVVWGTRIDPNGESYLRVIRWSIHFYGQCIVAIIVHVPGYLSQGISLSISCLSSSSLLFLLREVTPPCVLIPVPRSLSLPHHADVIDWIMADSTAASSTTTGKTKGTNTGHLGVGRGSNHDHCTVHKKDPPSSPPPPRESDGWTGTGTVTWRVIIRAAQARLVGAQPNISVLTGGTWPVRDVSVDMWPSLTDGLAGLTGRVGG